MFCGQKHKYISKYDLSVPQSQARAFFTRINFSFVFYRECTCIYITDCESLTKREVIWTVFRAGNSEPVASFVVYTISLYNYIVLVNMIYL